MSAAEREPILVVTSDEEATLIAGALGAEGIEVVVDSRTFKQEPVRFGLLGNVRLYVAPEDEERARQILAGLEQGVELEEGTLIGETAEGETPSPATDTEPDA